MTYVPTIIPDIGCAEVARAVVLQRPHERLAACTRRLAGLTRRICADADDHVARLHAVATLPEIDNLLAEIDALEAEMRS
ncbi:MULTISPECIES: hypothetical protein [Afifella]|uniref:hypothetical protein n=1 Tax=Afifella TaxID=643217 RepID=UPI000FE33F58|nr:hypothetical protein [Afifella aestuarii]